MNITFHCKSVKTESDFMTKQQIVTVDAPNEMELITHLNFDLMKEHLESMGCTVILPQEDAA